MHQLYFTVIIVKENINRIVRKYNVEVNKMNATDFIKDSILKLNSESFRELERHLIGEYISFAFLDEDEININNLSEKLYDYFEKIVLKNTDSFEIIIKKYINNWDEMVGKYIAKEHATKKNETPLPLPRSRRYYNFAMEIRRSRSITMRQLVDYSRIMMCLYTSVIDNNNSIISDFDYSVNFMPLDRMIASMKAEKSNAIMFKKKMLFDIQDLYSSDTSTLIITMIMYYCIENSRIQGGY